MTYESTTALRNSRSAADLVAERIVSVTVTGASLVGGLVVCHGIDSLGRPVDVLADGGTSLRVRRELAEGHPAVIHVPRWSVRWTGEA